MAQGKKAAIAVMIAS